MKSVLFIGLGSIAKKHIRVINKLLPGARLTALRSEQGASGYENVENIFSWNEVQDRPDFIIISNPTQLHKEAILRATDWGSPLFIEKPVLASPFDAKDIWQRLEDRNILTYVACNLRFHPCLQYIRKEISEGSWRVNEVNIYCGSDLSTWRPGTDYKKSYSAFSSMGGGVHLDLIHEIDYSYWLFGKPMEVISLKRKVSDLQIESPDFAAFHLIYPMYTVNICLNYYRSTPKREMEIVTGQNVYVVDLLNATVKRNDEVIFSDISFTMEQTYISQMKYFLRHISQAMPMMNDFEESIAVLKIATS